MTQTEQQTPRVDDGQTEPLADASGGKRAAGKRAPAKKAGGKNKTTQKRHPESPLLEGLLRIGGHRHKKAAVEWRRAVTAWKSCVLSRGERVERFSGIEKVCVFVGYPRSGHSLVGALVDAHPEAIIAHEEDILQYLQFRTMRWLFTRDQVLQILLDNSRRYAANGRKWTGFSYVINGQHQGEFSRLRVIGDKKGGATSNRLRRDPLLAERFGRLVGHEVSYVHVIRNPYDNIATMARRQGTTVEASTKKYFGLVETVQRLRETAGDRVLDVYHEKVVADPASEMTRLCSFMGLDAEAGYLQACAELVYGKPHRSRLEAEWSNDAKREVQSAMAGYDFLRHYTFDA